jgi:hypothetical protein
MKNKSKQIMKSNSQLNTILIDKIGVKESIKKKREKNESITLTDQIRDLSHEMRITQ